MPDLLTLPLGKLDRKALEQAVRLLLHAEPALPEPSRGGDHGGLGDAHRQVGRGLVP